MTYHPSFFPSVTPVFRRMPEEERPGPQVPKEADHVSTKANGKKLIEVLDPLKNKITLDVETWDRHISVRHPEMKNHFEAIKSALEAPMLIQRAPDGSSTCFYYKLTGRSFSRLSDLYVSVVVDLPSGSGTGRVKTAHLMKNVRQGAGEILWLQHNQK